MAILDIIGDFLGTSNTGAVNSGVKNLEEIKAYADRTGAANRGLYDDYFAQMQGLYGVNAAKYNDAVARLAEAIGNREDFEYKGDVNDFLDPAREQRVAAAMGAIENAGASGGNRFSSNYLDKVAAKQQALASEEWKAAYDKLMQDRNQQLQKWQTGQQKIDNMGTLAGIYGGDRTALSEAIGNYYSNMANQNNADLEVMSDIQQGKANLNASRSNGVMDLLGGASKVAGAIFA